MTKRSINQLDDIQLRRIIAAGLPTSKLDGAGLTFTLSKAGTASWVLRFMLNRKAKELTLGNYPDLSLAAARKLAREKRVEIDQGRDPAAEKVAAKARSMTAWTVAMLADDFLSKGLSPQTYSKVTISARTYDVNKVLRPKLGNTEARAVTGIDIVHLVKSLKSPWSMKERLLVSARKMFDHAIGLQIIEINPCASVKVTTLEGPRPPRKKRIMLTEGELRVLLNQAYALGPMNETMLKLLLATCVRTQELAMARWEYVDFEKKIWWVPDVTVKTRNGFLVPLAPQVIEWFKFLKRAAGDSPWVLPARKSTRRDKFEDGGHIYRSTLRESLNRAFINGKIEVRRFTPHDTRSTAKGHMRNMGVSREISELALNHVLQGMDAIYDVREEVPERREAMKLWSDFIEKCSQPETLQPDAGSPTPSESDLLPSPT